METEAMVTRLTNNKQFEGSAQFTQYTGLKDGSPLLSNRTQSPAHAGIRASVSGQDAGRWA